MAYDKDIFGQVRSCELGPGQKTCFYSSATPMRVGMLVTALLLFNLPAGCASCIGSIVDSVTNSEEHIIDITEGRVKLVPCGMEEFVVRLRRVDREELGVEDPLPRFTRPLLESVVSWHDQVEATDHSYSTETMEESGSYVTSVSYMAYRDISVMEAYQLPLFDDEDGRFRYVLNIVMTFTADPGGPWTHERTSIGLLTNNGDHVCTTAIAADLLERGGVEFEYVESDSRYIETVSLLAIRAPALGFDPIEPPAGGYKVLGRIRFVSDFDVSLDEQHRLLIVRAGTEIVLQ